MKWFKKLIGKINKYPFTRNLVLAICAVIVFIFLVTVMLNVFTRHGTSRSVPDFKGMKIEKVGRAARRASVRMEIADSLYIPAYEPGMVLDQTPKPGTKVKSGRRVFLTINAAQRKKVEIPYVAGYSLRQAKNILEMAGLEIDKLTYRADMATNNVLEERYQNKAITATSKIQAEVGSGVTLVVGVAPGAAGPNTPKVVGFPLKEAKSRIWESGLNVGVIEFDEDINLLNQVQAKVWWQSPDFPQKISYGSKVNIKLTLDEDKVTSGAKQSDARSKAVASKQAEEEADSLAKQP